MALRRAATSLAARTGLSMRAVPTGPAPADAFRGALTRWMSTFADNVKYAPTHEWAKLEGDTVTVGISDHAQSELGDVVYVELPEVGSQVNKGESFGVVESVKSASDVYSPVDGEVVEVNGALADDPAKLNADAFGGGWMMKVKVGGAGATDGLLDAAAYKKSVGA